MARSANNSNEKSDRNREIFREREQGALIVKLSEKYNLSIPRIHRIVMQEENKVLKEDLANARHKLTVCERKLK